jgi:ubiquinone/menaquinone biosynthesis C-methylase UbiE
MRRFPRLAARLYDLQARLTLSAMYRRVAQEIAWVISNGAVLDVGTGPGRLPLELARLSPALAVTGVDLSSEMIELARRKARKADMESRVAFIPGDATALPVPDASFDMVVVTLSLHHWHDQPKGMAELHRAMKPGGVTWVYDLYSDGIRQAFEELIGWSPFLEYEMSQVNYSRWMPNHGLLKIELR